MGEYSVYHGSFITQAWSAHACLVGQSLKQLHLRNGACIEEEMGTAKYSHWRTLKGQNQGEITKSRNAEPKGDNQIRVARDQNT